MKGRRKGRKGKREEGREEGMSKRHEAETRSSFAKIVFFAKCQNWAIDIVNWSLAVASSKFTLVSSQIIQLLQIHIKPTFLTPHSNTLTQTHPLNPT